MGKIGQVAIVTLMIGVVYLIMLIVMPFLMETASTANATITASGVNITAHPGSTDILFIGPYVLWYVPGGIGLAIIVGILKRK